MHKIAIGLCALLLSAAATGPVAAQGAPTAAAVTATDLTKVTTTTAGEFTGLDDYAWDFNAPNSMPGFGPIETKNVEPVLGQVPGNDQRRLTK